MPEDQQDKFEKVRRWEPVVDKLLHHPAVAQECPFCGKTKVHASWSPYNDEPRAASFDAVCDGCGEKMHAAVLVPDGSPDAYSTGDSKT